MIVWNDCLHKVKCYLMSQITHACLNKSYCVTLYFVMNIMTKTRAIIAEIVTIMVDENLNKTIPLNSCIQIQAGDKKNEIVLSCAVFVNLRALYHLPAKYDYSMQYDHTVCIILHQQISGCFEYFVYGI